MLDYIRSWFIVKKGEKGQDLAEYALLIGLIFQNITDILAQEVGISP
jgi:hypothetical protein